MADASDLKSDDENHKGSSPFSRTINMEQSIMNLNSPYWISMNGWIFDKFGGGSVQISNPVSVPEVPIFISLILGLFWRFWR